MRKIHFIFESIKTIEDTVVSLREYSAEIPFIAQVTDEKSTLETTLG